MIDELATLVIGRDPCEVLPIVERLYVADSGAGSTGGVLLNAISGIDAALWDLAARTMGCPSGSSSAAARTIGCASTPTVTRPAP